MKIVEWSFAVIAFLLLGADEALACRCPPTAASADVSRYAAVFSGRVAEVKYLPTGVRVRFRVGRVWKGGAAPEVTLFLEGAGRPQVVSSCDITFRKGESYLVYALRAREGGPLTTHKCTRTRRTAEAAEDFAALGAGRAPEGRKR